MFLLSDQWQIMAVKQFSSGVYQEVGNVDTFDIIPGNNDMTLKLLNITDRDGTRFRCTFFASFAAPRSTIQVGLKGERVHQQDIPAESRFTSDIELEVLNIFSLL